MLFFPNHIHICIHSTGNGDLSELLAEIHAVKSCQTAFKLVLSQCFSTGVPPVVSKGSAGLPVLSKKNKLRLTFAAAIDAFSRLLVGPKCICGRSSAQRQIVKLQKTSQKRQQLPNSATNGRHFRRLVAEIGDYSRQCGQGLTHFESKKHITAIYNTI